MPVSRGPGEGLGRGGLAPAPRAHRSWAAFALHYPRRVDVPGLGDSTLLAPTAGRHTREDVARNAGRRHEGAVAK
jgi:hypothetical protein